MTKRNPCTYLIETFDSSGQYLVKQERRGYAQERKTFDGEEQIFVMEGGDTGIGYWYPKDEVRLIHGGWKNKTSEPTRKSMWTRAK